MTIERITSWFDTINISDWIVIPVTLLAVLLMARILMRTIHPLLMTLTKNTVGDLDNEIVAGILRPLEFIVMVLLLTLITPALALEDSARTFLSQIETTLYSLGAIWLAFLVTDITIARKIKQLSEAGMSAGASVMPLLRRVIKIVLSVIIILFLLQNLGIDIGALLAGLGIGGLAIALAGQKTIENLFGGIVLVLDQPVNVGDFCRIGVDLLGTVEDIGLRSTRVRTLDRTLVSIPNADFSQMRLENFGKRDRIRLFTTIGVRYETTPDQMRYLLIELRKMLLAHPKIDREPNRVRLMEFAAYSLNIEILAYVLTQQWAEFVAVKEDIYLRIMEIVNASGTSFAFPSQTVYMERGSGVDETQTKSAEQQVQKWREENQLFMPDIPLNTIEELDDTIVYPPPGGSEHDSTKT